MAPAQIPGARTRPGAPTAAPASTTPRADHHAPGHRAPVREASAFPPAVSAPTRPHLHLFGCSPPLPALLDARAASACGPGGPATPSPTASDAVRTIISRDPVLRSSVDADEHVQVHARAHPALVPALPTVAFGDQARRPLSRSDSDSSNGSGSVGTDVSSLSPTPYGTPCAASAPTTAATELSTASSTPSASRGKGLAFMQSIFPRFNLERARRRVAHRAAQRKLSVPSQPDEDSVKIEDAELEPVVAGWTGAVLAVRQAWSCGRGEGGSDADLDSSEDEVDPRAVRTLYGSLPLASAQFVAGGPREADASLPTELREALLHLMDHASETLRCDRIVLSVQADMPIFRSLLHGLCYVGGYVVSYGPQIERAYAALALTRDQRRARSRTEHSVSSRGARSQVSTGRSQGSSASMSAYSGATLVPTSESEYEGSTMGLPGVQGLVPAPGLVLVAVDL